jgi:SOS-response transcriptional repressor LexA
MDFLQRLHAAVMDSGLSKKEVAGRADMSAYKLSRLLNDRLKRPNLRDIEKVLAAIGKRIEDLYAGEPSIDVRQALRALTEYVDRHESARSTPPAAVVGTLPARPKKRRSRTVVAYSLVANPNVVWLDSGKAGRAKIPPELWERGARRAARVSGDSMVDAGIRDGDLVFFAPAPSRNAALNKIVVIRVNAAVYLKYYKDVGGQKMLLSAKEGLDPILIKPDDDVELYGIAVLPRAAPTPARMP